MGSADFDDCILGLDMNWTADWECRAGEEAACAAAFGLDGKVEVHSSCRHQALIKGTNPY